MLPRAIIVDLDGTLASVRWRLHHLDAPRKDWRSFFAGMARDAPVPWVADLMRADHGEVVRLVVTGRPDDYREVCEAWLRRHRIPYDQLLMRRRGDRRPDHIVKAELFDHAIRLHYEVAFVVDDRPNVVRMWRERGLHVIVPEDPGSEPLETESPEVQDLQSAG